MFVADLLRSKLALISDASRLVLQIAACFGDSFNGETLSLVWASIVDGDESCREMAIADLGDNMADGDVAYSLATVGQHSTAEGIGHE